MAAATATATAAGPSDADDFSRVYKAVASGATKQELRRVIDECAKGDQQRRLKAVNHAETPLQAAHRLKRGDLVGALVEAGADVCGIFRGQLTPLAVCIAYGQVDSVRALLRSGHDANGKVDWDGPSYGRHPLSCRPAHVCLAPPPLGLASDHTFYNRSFGAPQIGCLEVLVKEGGADVNALSSFGETPIFWLARCGSKYEEAEHKAARELLVAAGARTSGVFNSDCSPLIFVAAESQNHRLARFLIEEAGVPVDERSPGGGYTALDNCCWAGDEDPELAALLLDAGADVNATTKFGSTPLFGCVAGCKWATTRILLDRGALANVIDSEGCTPLILACEEGDDWLSDEGWPLFREILRRSSDETRCVERIENEGDPAESAADILLRHMAEVIDESPSPPDDEDLRVQKRLRWTLAELLASGVSLRPENAAAVLPILASLSARHRAEMAARNAELCSWRAHEIFVGLSLDVRDLREAQRAVLQRRVRLAALELELFERGVGSGSSSSDSDSGSSSGEEGEDDSDGSSGSDDGDGESSSEGGGSEDESESEEGGATAGATTGGGGGAGAK